MRTESSLAVSDKMKFHRQQAGGAPHRGARTHTSALMAHVGRHQHPAAVAAGWLDGGQRIRMGVSHSDVVTFVVDTYMTILPSPNSESS